MSMEGKSPSAKQALIRKLTTEKAVKSYCQQKKEEAAAEDDISDIKLSGRGIKTIESLDLPCLRRLDLSKNNLNRLKGLHGCPQVTYLTTAGNELTGEGLDGVRPLRDLKVFNASGNRVKRIPPAVFAQFRQLQALVLNNNDIREVPPTWLKKGLLSLNTLVLSHNKVQSLADAKLGRLTALTKLSVSHNLLSELPDLSACTALEELRAAHNLINQVPASLGKNVALRTLDLGHNQIESWEELELAGKTLKSLVQLSLSANPICRPSGGGTPGGNLGVGEEQEAVLEEDGYVTKIRSLFPDLKVRDGKRILMKKAHTYYEQRGTEGRKVNDGHPSPREGKALSTEPSRISSGDRLGNGIRMESGDSRSSTGRQERRRLKGTDARGNHGQRSGNEDMEEAEDQTMTSKERKKRKKVARVENGRKSEGEALGTEPDIDGRSRESGKENEGNKQRLAPRDLSPNDTGAEKKRKHGSMGSTELHAGTDGKEKRKQHRRAKSGDGQGSSTGNQRKEGAVDGDGLRQEPHSFSPKRSAKVPGDDVGSSGDAPAAINGDQQGAGGSGVVSVVVNKKKKGAKVSKKKLKAWEGDEKLHGDGNGAKGGEESFSVVAMLEARGQRETVGSGSGTSAWD